MRRVIVKKEYTVAIVGVTGLVGSHFISILDELDLPLKTIRVFASKKSKGKKIFYKGDTYIVEELEGASLIGIDYALFSAGQGVAKKYIPIFVENGIKVIDNSSYFRMDDNVPLVVPEVNFDDNVLQKMIISNPNCSTIQCMPPLHLIDLKYHLKRVFYSTYQSVSGSGQKGIFDLQSALEGYPFEFYEVDISKECYPLIGKINQDGYSEEENKMINETRKILNINNLDVEATCVRVPILYGHGVSVIFETEQEIDFEELKNSFNNISSVKYHEKIIFPADITKDNDIHIMRLRISKNNKKRGSFYCFSNNLRKGAALNAIQILQRLISS